MSKYSAGVFMAGFLISLGLHTSFARTIAVLIGIVLLIECWDKR